MKFNDFYHSLQGLLAGKRHKAVAQRRKFARPLCSAISELTHNDDYRDNEFTNYFRQMLGFGPSGSMSNQLANGRTSRSVDDKTLIALFYIAKFSRDYDFDVSEAEEKLFGKGKTYEDYLKEQEEVKPRSDSNPQRLPILKITIWSAASFIVAGAILIFSLDDLYVPLADGHNELTPQVIQTIQGIWGEPACHVTYYIKPTKTSIRMTSQPTEYGLPPLEVEMSIRSVVSKPEVFIEAFEVKRSDNLALVDVGISYVVSDGMETLTLDHHGERNQLDLVRCEGAR